MSGDDTASEAYADRLRDSSNVWWKRLLRVQAIYGWNVRRHDPGFTLDVGCGIGRNLAHLDGNGVGVDHNESAVGSAVAAGLTAFTPQQFAASEFAVASRFDSLLMAHVIEHMRYDEAAELLGSYLPYLAPGGKVILICPQEAGYRSDDTHVEFADVATLRRLCSELEISVDRDYSFPLPRFMGKWFRYNEFVMVGRR